MQNAAFTISRKLPKSAFLSKKGPFLGTKMAPTPKILSFPEIPLVELFQELRGTLWRMFQVLGVAGFCGEIILKSEKMTIYIGGTLSKIFFFGKFRKIPIFLWPQNCLNTILIACKDILMPYPACNYYNSVISGRKT